MNFWDWVLLVITVGLLIYLTVAMLWSEKF